MKKDNLKRDINLFEAIFKDKTKKTRDMEKDIKTSVKVFVGVACLCLVVLGGQCAINAINTSVLKKQNAELATPEKLQEIADNKKKRDELKTQNEQLQAKLNEFDGITKLKLESIAKIAYEQPQTLNIVALSYEEGVMELTCQGPDELMGSYFAQNLRESGNFIGVECTNTTKSKDNIYTSQVSVVLEVEKTEEKGGTK